jgi:hypothetical protein
MYVTRSGKPHARTPHVAYEDGGYFRQGRRPPLWPAQVNGRERAALGQKEPFPMRGLSCRGLDLTRLRTDMPAAGIGASGSSVITQTSYLVHPTPIARPKSAASIWRALQAVGAQQKAFRMP